MRGSLQNCWTIIFLIQTVYAVQTHCPLNAVVNKLCISAAVDRTGQWAVFTVQSASAGWAAIGVGESMASADIQVGWQNSTGGITLSDRTAEGHQVPTFDEFQDIAPAPMIAPRAVWAKLQFSYRRPITAVRSSEDRPIPLSKIGGQSVPIRYIWAVSRSTILPDFIDDPATNFPSHSEKGTFLMDFFPPNRVSVNLGLLPRPGSPAALLQPKQTVTAPSEQDAWPTDSEIQPTEAVSSEGEITNIYEQPQASSQPFLTNIPYELSMLIHGLLMMFAWNIAAPAGAFVARHLKFKGKIWYSIHVGFLFGGTVLFAITGFVFVILYVTPPYFSIKDPHSIIGLSMMCGLVLQFVVGFFASRKYNPDQKPQWGNILHMWLGRFLILLSIPEMYLGIQLYSPNAFVWQAGYSAALFLVAIFFILAEFKGRLKWFKPKLKPDDLDNKQWVQSQYSTYINSQERARNAETDNRGRSENAQPRQNNDPDGVPLELLKKRTASLPRY